MPPVVPRKKEPTAGYRHPNTCRIQRFLPK
jgi:hypothetical protein